MKKTNQRILVLAAGLLVLIASGYVSKVKYDTSVKWDGDRASKILEQDSLIRRQADTIDSVKQETRDLTNELKWYRNRWEQQMEEGK